MTAASHRKDDPQEHPQSAAADIDSALSRLRAGDRDAILLRYFEGHSFHEVGRQLRISEEAARKRVSRGLDRLRQVLKPAGGALPNVAAIELTLHSALHTAPPGLAAATLKAVAAGPAAVGAGATLAKGATILMAISKGKAVAVGALAVLLIGGGTVATIRVIHPSSDESVAIAPSAAGPGAAVTTVGSDTWQEAFQKAYGLADGEVIKSVNPTPEKQQFWDDQCRRSGGKGWKLAKNEFITIEWDGKSFHWSSLGSMGTVLDAVGICARVKPYQIDSSMQKQLPDAQSDWVSRKGATTEAQMAALARIASQRLGHEVRFEKRRVIRDAIIVRGHLSTAPGVVTISDGRYPKNLGQPPTQQGSVAELLQTLEDRVRRKVFNETGDTATRVTYRDLMPDDSHIPQVLDRLAKETSLTFTIEPRELEVWFVADGAATTAASK